MNILEMAEELRKIAERKSKETGLTIQEVWSESTKELNDIIDKEYKEDVF